MKARYSTLSPLSRYWNREALEELPARAVVLALAYPVGMVGYTLELPLRVALFVKELFHFMGSLGFYLGRDGFSEAVKVRLLCLGGALGEVFSALVGTICPPAAYMIDEQIQANLTIATHCASRFFWKGTPPQTIFACVGSYFKPWDGKLTGFDKDDLDTFYCMGILVRLENNDIEIPDSLKTMFSKRRLITLLKLKAIRMSHEDQDFKLEKLKELDQALEVVSGNCNFETLYSKLHHHVVSESTNKRDSLQKAYEAAQKQILHPC